MDPRTANLGPDDREVENWFVRQGLPHFIGDYRASTDVFTRATPFLVLVFLFQIAGALDVDRRGWRETVALAAGAVIILGAGVAVNRVRGRRPFQVPDHFGLLEAAVFVFVPPFVPLLLGGTELAGALGVVVFQLVVLAVTWLVVGFGLLWMTRWAVVHAVRQVGDITNLMLRSLPILLLFTTFLFLNAELWQVAADFTLMTFWVTIGLLAGAALAFLMLRLPREVEGLARFGHWGAVDAALPGSLSGLGQTTSARPAASDEVSSAQSIDTVVQDGLGQVGQVLPHPAGSVSPPLGLAERVNLLLVLVFSQGVQILLVAVVIGAFYVVFGLFAVREDTILQWTELTGTVDAEGVAHLPDDQVLLRLLDRQVTISIPLIRTCGFLAAFSGLQFTVSALTDQTYREEFFDDVVSDVRSALAARARYLQRGSF